MKKMHVMPLTCIFLLVFEIPLQKRDCIFIVVGFSHGHCFKICHGFKIRDLYFLFYFTILYSVNITGI